MPFRSVLIACALASFAVPAAAGTAEPISDALAAKITANPDRSYPPSCLPYPLPTTVRGPSIVLQNVRLGDFDGTYDERLTVTMWRAACAGGKSAVLLKFQRPAGAPANQFADVPIPFITQGAQSQRLGRLHFEPNTFNSEVNGHAIGGDVTLVLETASGERIDFNQAFKVELGTIVANQALLYEFSMPAYNAAQHPDGTLALEITGYVAGSWYDPARGGEGMVVEVGERANGAKYAGFAWYTYDAQGNPSWIVGNQDLPTTGPVPRTVTIPGLFLRGGGFAGNFNPANLDARPWGTVTLTFPSCNAMRLDFASAAVPPPGAPTGSGTRNWQRLVSLNGLTCD